MAHKYAQQKIFRIVLVGIVLVGVVGACGWYVWLRSIKTQPAQNTVVDHNENYFTIEEWGVRFKGVAGLRDFRYFRVDTGAADDAFALSTAGLIAVEPHCGSDGFATIVRQKQPPVFYEKALGTIGEYAYYYRGSDSACSQDSSHFQQESYERALVLESLSSLEAMR